MVFFKTLVRRVTKNGGDILQKLEPREDKYIPLYMKSFTKGLGIRKFKVEKTLVVGSSKRAVALATKNKNGSWNFALSFEK